MAYIPETVMNCDVDYVNKPEKYKCLGNTIDGNIFNKHNEGTTKLRNENEMKRNERKRNEIQRNETKNEEMKRNEMMYHKPKRNTTKRNEK